MGAVNGSVIVCHRFAYGASFRIHRKRVKISLNYLHARQMIVRNGNTLSVRIVSRVEEQYRCG